MTLPFKKLLFYLGLLVIINILLISFINYQCRNILTGYYCDYNAFGIESIFQAVIYGLFVILFVIYLFIKKRSINTTLPTSGVVIVILSFLVAIIPIIMNFSFIMSAQKNIFQLNQRNSEQAQIDAQNCADYKAKLKILSTDTSLIPTPPENCR